jgi:two-component system nitrate/nitrite response regulator NarL
MMPTTVAIADDHPIVLRGLSALIDADPAFRVVATAADGGTALEAIRAATPDIAVLDLNMPQRSGLSVLRELRRLDLPTRTVVLAAAATDAEIYDILDAGAAGLMFKEAATDQLLDCLHAVAAGGQWLPAERTEGAATREAARRGKWRRLSSRLTSREVQIVQLVIDGVTNKALAFRLQVSEGTAKVHLNNIFRKLEVGSRSELVELAGGQAGEPQDAR